MAKHQTKNQGESSTVRLIRQWYEHHLHSGFQTPEDLILFVEGIWNLVMPRRPVVPGHSTPTQFLVDSFFEAPDAVVWASRGGGKTMAGALVTWLDCIFNSRAETKILGGSGEQSLRFYGHFKDFISPPFQHLIEGEPLRTMTHLTNGSSVQILTASTKSVRGPHPQRVKLDEIDEFTEEIYEAALLIPKSAHGIRASVQIFSTMHKAYGLMNRVVSEAAEAGYRVYKWSVLDILEQCVDRDCDSCELWEDCEGRARDASGFYSIEDAISHKRRVSRETWESEMLCKMPSQEGLIYREFDLSVHVI